MQSEWDIVYVITVPHIHTTIYTYKIHKMDKSHQFNNSRTSYRVFHRQFLDIRLHISSQISAQSKHFMWKIWSDILWMIRCWFIACMLCVTIVAIKCSYVHNIQNDLNFVLFCFRFRFVSFHSFVWTNNSNWLC